MFATVFDGAAVKFFRVNLLRDYLSCVQGSPHCAHSTERLALPDPGGCLIEIKETRCGLKTEVPRAWIGGAGQARSSSPYLQNVSSYSSTSPSHDLKPKKAFIREFSERNSDE
jgi:hypothetical protein